MLSLFFIHLRSKEVRQWRHKLGGRNAYMITWIRTLLPRSRWTTSLRSSRLSCSRHMIWRTRNRVIIWMPSNTSASSNSNCIRLSRLLTNNTLSLFKTSRDQRMAILKFRPRNSLPPLAAKTQRSTWTEVSPIVETSSSLFGSNFHLESTNQCTSPSSQLCKEANNCGTRALLTLVCCAIRTLTRRLRSTSTVKKQVATTRY